MEPNTTFINNFWEKANKKRIIGAAITLFVVLVISIGVLIYINTPAVVAARAVSKFANDLVDRNEFSAISQTLTNGSIEASLSSITVDDNEVFEDASVSGKMYFATDAFMLENFLININDFKLSGDVYLSSDLVYIQEDEILDGAYGIEKDSFADDLRGSIFAYNSGSDYEIFDDEGLYNALLQAYDDPQDEAMMKDAEKIVKNYTKEFYKIVCKYADFESKNDQVKIDGKKQNVRVITITIDEKAVAAIYEEMIEFIVNDDSIIKFIEKYDSQFALVEYQYGIESIVSWYEDMLDTLDDNIDEMCDMIESADFEIEIEMVTPRASVKILQLTMSANNEKMFTLDVGSKGIKKTDKITLSSGNNKIVYEIKDNSNKAYKASLKTNGKEYVSINIDYNKEKYEINLGNKEDSSIYITIKGEISKSGKTYTMSLDTIECEQLYGGYKTTIETDLEITMKTKDKIPNAPKEFTTIDDIEESDIEAWMEKIYN